MSNGWDDPADPPNDAVVVGDGRVVVRTTRGAGVGPNAFVTQGAGMILSSLWLAYVVLKHRGVETAHSSGDAGHKEVTG